MRIIYLPDAHLEHDRPFHPSYLIARQVVRDVKPDLLIIGGDMAEMGCFSYWNKLKPRIMENKRYAKDVTIVRQELTWLRTQCNKMVYLEGNHEDWINQHLDANPQLEGLVDYPRDVGVYDLGIEWVKVNNVYEVGDINFIHGWYHNMYHAKKHVEDMGSHVIYGHVHDHQVYIKPIKAKRSPHIAMSMGCLCDLNPHFLRGKPNRWINGFGIIEVDSSSGIFNPYFVGIYRDRAGDWICTYGSERWTLREEGHVGYRSKNQSNWTEPVNGAQCVATFRPGHEDAPDEPKGKGHSRSKSNPEV
jgi:hypothetical protein